MNHCWLSLTINNRDNWHWQINQINHSLVHREGDILHWCGEERVQGELAPGVPMVSVEPGTGTEGPLVLSSWWPVPSETGEASVGSGWGQSDGWRRRSSLGGDQLIRFFVLLIQSFRKLKGRPAVVRASGLLSPPSGWSGTSLRNRSNIVFHLQSSIFYGCSVNDL